MEDAGKCATSAVRAPASFIVMHISPAFFEQPTPFPHIPSVYCTFTLNFNNLPLNSTVADSNLGR
jgi:hypothetical protein